MSPKIDSSQVHASAYYWTSRPNFGDLLTSLLMDHFAEVTIDWAPVEQAQLVCVGSVLDVLPSDWSGIVAGAGKMFEDREIQLPYADVRAVRGPLSAVGFIGYHSNLILGDPGLLADELVEVEKEHVLGIVPHWSDTELEHRPEFAKYAPLIIRAADDPLTVLRQIGSCRKIISSSLHGIIVADAFGIPRRTEVAHRFQSEGGTFKFRDYNASVGVRFEVGVTQEAPRFQVQNRQEQLFDMFVELGQDFGARS